MSISPISAKSRRNAFTLIELLIVIAIIGVLAAILIPVIGAVRNSTNRTKSLSNLRQVYVAADLYSMDHKGYVVPGGEGVFWVYSLFPYLEFDDVTDATSRAAEEMMTCPGFNDSNEWADWSWGYGINIKPGLPESTMQNRDDGNEYWTKDFLKISITEPTNRMFFCASSMWQVNESDMTWPAFDRFGDDKCPVVFFDGHTASLTQEELQQSIANPGNNATLSDDS